MYKIFTLKNYKTKRDDPKIIITGDKNQILEALTNDKGYHELLMDDIEYNLFYDIDKIPLDQDYLIYDFIELLSKISHYDITDIKYTLSKKETLSFHISIPRIRATLATQLGMAKKIKERFDYIDLAVYQNNRFFRLPNQTNKEKPLAHIIINGSMMDFVLAIEQPNSVVATLKDNIEEIPIKEYEIKKTYATDEQIKQMLELLPKLYLDDYSKWIIITNILKGQDKQDLWNNWSKKSKQYNYRKNLSIWKSTKKIMFDIQYLIKLTNFNLFKIYTPIIEQKKMKQMNNKYLYDKNNNNAKFTYDDFLKNQTIILESCTGTGKTTAVAEHTSNYLEDNKHLNVLSIISRITLGDQHIKSFNSKNIKMFSYSNGLVKNKHFIVCINSLLMMKDLKDDDFKNYIVFIDEINSFIEHLTHNETLHHDLKKIYSLLMRIIKNAHKVIVADALISDSVFTFLKARQDYFFIKNDFKKYDGINAHRLKDENDFKVELERRIKNNEPFFFGCDSCTIVEEYFYYFYEQSENKDMFCLFTANHKFNIVDANEQFRNKFLFFSPAITTAVDFNIETKQDVFIYIKGQSILPSGSFQQTTRTRNIKELFYYSSCSPSEPKYNNLDEVKDKYNSMVITNDLLTEMSLYVDEDDNIKMSNNTFFNLFCYNEYVKDTYNTNKLSHYEEILKQNKFILDSKGEKSKIDPEIKIEMADLRTDIDDNFFNDFLNSSNRNDDKYKVILDRIELLNLPINNDEILTTYKEYLMNPHKLTTHLNIIRFFKTDHYIQVKLAIASEKNFKVKQFDNIYNKISIFRNLQTKFNLSLDMLNYINNDTVNFSDTEWDHIKKVFRYTKEKPTTLFEFKPVYIQMIKSITDTQIIDSKRERNNGGKINIYKFNQDYLKEHIYLNSISNPNYFSYDPKYNSLLGIKANVKNNNNEYKGNLDENIFD
jgi:hypothetical protein